MSIPIVSEDCALAVLSKMHTESQGCAEWTFANAEEFGVEQPALFFSITENLKQLHPADEDGAINAAKSLYVAMMTYRLIKAAVEAEQLNDMFGGQE